MAKYFYLQRADDIGLTSLPKKVNGQQTSEHSVSMAPCSYKSTQECKVPKWMWVSLLECECGQQ
ncbi:hypothetical protein DPMN_026496 [Dreissena polymorpha]|uniref:Uncharacterized protein n=1 Tax=Dreissena polymorpha TaxID=45954 RepID=A0A9D4RED0_DREPO|nr:hypothetical protein DPMN_026496 [Dreissena polymorpha]